MWARTGAVRTWTYAVHTDLRDQRSLQRRVYGGETMAEVSRRGASAERDSAASPRRRRERGRPTWLAIGARDCGLFLCSGTYKFRARREERCRAHRLLRVPPARVGSFHRYNIATRTFRVKHRRPIQRGGSPPSKSGTAVQLWRE